MKKPNVREILSWHGGDNPSTLTNLAPLLKYGKLSPTGCLFILPVDKAFECGPAVSDETVYQELTAVRLGGGFGSIVGRNFFQRMKPDALPFLGNAISIYAN